MRRNLLKGIFAAAVLVAGTGIASAQKVETAPVANNQPAAAHAMSRWDEICLVDSLPYDPDPHAHCYALPKAENATGLQVESESQAYRALILEPGCHPGLLTNMHNQAAAHVMNTAADMVSDVPVHCIESSDTLTDWIYDLDHKDTIAIFQPEQLYPRRVVNLSMGFYIPGNQNWAHSPGRIDTFGEINRADRFWASTDVIMFQSAGNDGDDPGLSGLQRPWANHFMRADLHVFIGEAALDHTGRTLVVAHSAANSPGFITLHPYCTGGSYPYIRRGADLAARLNSIYDSQPPGFPKPLGEIFDQKILHYATALEAWQSGAWPNRPSNPFTRTDRRLFTRDFPGRSLLQTDDPAALRSDLAAVRTAFINALVASAEAKLAERCHDGHGNVMDLKGTSFSSPFAAGLALRALETHPGLQPVDVLAAAFIAAEPVPGRLWPMGLQTPLQYNDNGAGLPVEPLFTGFGFVDEREMDRVVSEMDRLMLEHPELATQRQETSTGLLTEFTVCTPATDSSVPAGMVEYRFDVEDDILAFKTKLAIEFLNGGAGAAPCTLMLINPAGVGVPMSPTKRYAGGEGSVSIAVSNLHFGNRTKGTWALRMPENCRIDILELDIVGAQPGGLIDTYLQQHLEAEAQARLIADLKAQWSAAGSRLQNWAGQAADAWQSVRALLEGGAEAPEPPAEEPPPVPRFVRFF